jgi:hypothetical protein
MRTVIKSYSDRAAVILFSWCALLWRHSERVLAGYQTGKVERPIINNSMQRHDVLW